MTTAAEYLASFVAVAPQTPPSITISTIQRNNAPAGTNNWKPGIACYGWGLNGRVVDGAGLRFEVMAWFSDRLADRSATPPAWQQFAAKARDDQLITLTPNGPDVTATIVLITWGRSTLTADSFMFEEGGQQLLFVAPGAGPGAPRAVLAISLHPTGQLGFL
ncbi:hypothetical protein [Actinoplanes sp. N902-109]|uniref:hypothetical protein n=1 Tax=Actinoplanes sp. (strain N902-109) TaxID=649831 RepID=UPI0003296562|nr:hypothetical protein [Actinoplanes sp. N902-109]AGL17035.1 hypothetical protein L083_3525 [Actinoplanes sp. N902-109]